MSNTAKQWPKTLAPKVYTQTPIPLESTNPPQVIPVSSEQPPEPKGAKQNGNRDAFPVAGTNDNADYRTDLGEYNLVIVKDKDIPDTAGYNPRSLLQYFPKGKLMGSHETFYIVTHRFADRAGINSELRGNLTVKTDSRGRPSNPFTAPQGGAGGAGDYRTTEKAEGSPATGLVSLFAIGIFVLLLVVLLFKGGINMYK